VQCSLSRHLNHRKIQSIKVELNAPVPGKVGIISYRGIVYSCLSALAAPSFCMPPQPVALPAISSTLP
jgi:hypothetical protein